jgi:transposase
MEQELKFNIQKLGSHVQEEVRKKIIREMKRHGDTKEVAKICECSLSHVQCTWKKYKDGGVKAIAAVKMGRPVGKCCKLNPKQEAAIKKHITDKSPIEAGLSGHLCGRKEVSELVKKQYGIEMPVTTMGDYLRKWNFTPQRQKKKITVKSQKK